MRIALALEYDGREFCGFQSQPSGCAVQDALERALASIAGQPLRIHAAGRTDAGVHATHQVVHFDTTVERPLTAWVRGVNTLLPAGVAVLWAAPVSEEFHARFAARARHYTYLLLDRAQRPGLLHGRVGWYHRPLALEPMARAAHMLLGTHDFTSFRAAECQARTPIRTLTTLRVTRVSGLLRLDCAADGFLHHMIRNILGALVAVGAGAKQPEWLAQLRDARDRTRGAPTFAPDGLYFTGADYAATFALPSLSADVPGLAP
jgi:tRNA pseudouridine38-40 synthase